MIRGTTPILEFDLPFDTELLEELYLTVSQRDTIKIEKSLSECKCDGKTVQAELSQEETLKLDDRSIADIQVRCKRKDGKTSASKITSVSVDKILKDGVI